MTDKILYFDVCNITALNVFNIRIIYIFLIVASFLFLNLIQLGSLRFKSLMAYHPIREGRIHFNDFMSDLSMRNISI